MSGVNVATVVMYHIVQPAGSGVLARLKGRGKDEFAEQIAYIRRHYSPVSLLDLAAAARGESTLPPRPVALTFDDGYASHARLVGPMLAEARIPATFFPVTSALVNRSVLNVNKIQCVLAAADVAAIVSRVEAAITAHGGTTPAEYRQQWFKPSRWDPAEVVYVKRLLQHALPEAVREPIVDELFRAHVTSDERGLADELYMTVDQARELLNCGMTIGAHADRHVRLPTLPRAEQAAEIDGALRVFDALAIPKTNFVYSYANGEFDGDSVDLLRARGCAAAVSTRAELATVRRDRLLSLPRIDTNDLPVSADAPPNEWTRRADTLQNRS